MAELFELKNFDVAVTTHAKLVKDFMSPDKMPANVVGFAVGEKWSKGVPSGKAALLALVTHKVPETALARPDIIPPEFDGVPTDVLQVGYVMAHRIATRMGRFEPFVSAPGVPNGNGGETVAEVRTVTPIPETAAPLLAPLAVLTRRERPAYGGDSVGHYKITAGTIGTCCYGMLPGAGINPPAPGLGVPPQFFILSNNHVLANCNAANIGDPILQPGPYDGGVLPDDKIAQLSNFVRITFDPPIPRVLHRNIVDAAIAEAPAFQIDRKLHWLGMPRAWRRKADVKVGLRVRKFGRTTGLTTGKVIAINATVDVGYPVGVARFMDQIITTNISAPGDSGSLVVTEDNVAVGLLFAGSSTVTILNYIENVRSLLRIEVAETIG